MKHTFREVFWSLLGIIVSGVVGGMAGWALFIGLDLPRVLNAVLAVIAGMVIATAVWLAITLILRRIGLVP